MRILLDECVDARVRECFPHDEVLLVSVVGWRSLKDGLLLAAAEGHIDVLVTIDRGIEHQQNWRKLPFGIVIVHVPRSGIDHYRPLFAELREAAQAVGPGQLLHVGASRRPHRRR